MKKYFLFFSILFTGHLNAAPTNKHPMDIYASNVQKSIQSRFYDVDLYKGKECEIKVTLDDNGKLISATPNDKNINNNKELCIRGIELIENTQFLPTPVDSLTSDKNVFFILLRL
ncbi:cell envelope integrity protein TolA [Providencia heimbachae]|uniref:cell envelope integrity protein TolA n=1 Tax=Providencia heimbachae TaxID=333962 RepID=UPI0020C82F93|nr:cell envelope integrity protein TolA [Providencia heimbachae]